MDQKPKVIERIGEDGAKEYGVRYRSGLIAWFSSLPAAMAAHSRAVQPKRKRRKI